ncbi:hypothetical protein DL95DRAFT_508300 [Leptodontidium sp. 2 PMI_412]|nr:hypothetical protein DL95DRAFT_508300 [Leptodontidium sp. 2 PMI_412]
MSSSASQVAFRTAIAAIYKTSTKEGVFFQDVLGGIRMGSYDNRWSGGTGPIPIAAISSPSLEKEMPWGWIQKANLGDALLGTSLASTAYPGTSRIAKPVSQFREMAATVKVGRIWLSQYLVSHTPTPYYTVADNRIKEKIWNAGTQVGWVDGTLNIQTIPGSNFNAITCIRGSSMILKAYLQPRSAGICCLGVGW